METKTMLQGENIQLLPFSSKYWSNVAAWFYDKEYSEMYRQSTRMLSEEDFKQYSRVMGGEVFMIHLLDSEKPIGMVQVIPSDKKNKAGYIGLIIDKEHQSKRLPTEVFLIFFDYLFNRQGYNKIIIEILENNTSLKNSIAANGFYREGKLIQECFIEGRYVNELRYSMTAYYFN